VTRLSQSGPLGVTRRAKASLPKATQRHHTGSQRSKRIAEVEGNYASPRTRARQAQRSVTSHFGKANKRHSAAQRKDHASRGKTKRHAQDDAARSVTGERHAASKRAF
jgi:hypothetical protein